MNKRLFIAFYYRWWC